MSLTHPSSPIVIEVKEEELDIPTAWHRASRDPQVHYWIMDFKEAVTKSFDPEPSEEALISVVKEAAKIPLNAIRVA